MDRFFKCVSLFLALFLLFSVCAYASGDPGMASAGPSGEPGPSGGMGASSEPSSYSAVLNCKEDTEISGKTLISETGDESVVHVSEGAVVSVRDSILENGGTGYGGDSASFYGVGATLLVTDGVLYASDDTITSTTSGGTGIFAYGDGTAYVSGCNISTSQASAGGLHVAGGGTLYAWDCVVDTSAPMAAAAIRSDRGGGKMVIDGGRYVTNGGTGAVYVTADISVHNAYLYSGASEAIAIEGKNTLRLFDCDLSGNMTASALNDNKVWNIIVYQSMSGDADVGTSEYDMIGGTLTCAGGPVVYNTNTSSYITFKNVEVFYGEETTCWLQVTGNSSTRTWGRAGNNGANCIFTASSQSMRGDVVYDSISSLDFYMLEGSELTGAIVRDDSLNGGYSGSKKANVYIDADSTWIVTGDSFISGTLFCAGSIQNAVITDPDGNILGGEGEYTVIADDFQSEADTSAAGNIPVWEDYAAENPFRDGFAAADTLNSDLSESQAPALPFFCDQLAELTPEEVIRLRYIRSGESQEEYEVTDKEAIRAVLNAIGNINVTGVTDMDAGEDSSILIFTTESGAYYTLVFKGTCLENSGILYTLDNAVPLWALLSLLRSAG